MSVLQENPALAADDKAIDELQQIVEKLTPAGKAKLEANLLTWGQIARGMKLVLGANYA